MKVIKEGIPGSAWIKQVSCTGLGNTHDGCAAILEINGHDVFHRKEDGASESFLSFECMCCGVWTDIQRTSMPISLVYKITAQLPRKR